MSTRPFSRLPATFAVMIDSKARIVVVACAAMLLSASATPASAIAGDQLWLKRYPGPGPAASGQDVVVSPDGATVYMASTVYLSESDAESDIATTAYDATTGARLWTTRYDGPAAEASGWGDTATAITTNPAGDLVFVTGSSVVGEVDQQMTTLAYDATTGEQVWAARFKPLTQTGPVEIAATDRRVFVAGNGYDVDTGEGRAAVAAYAVGSGHEAWSRIGPVWSRAQGMVLAPKGRRVTVTGSIGLYDDADMLTRAFAAGTGERLWRSRWNGADDLMDEGRSVAVSGDGITLFVTGASYVPPSEQGRDDIATLAYDAASGDELWAVRYDGPGGSYDRAQGIVADTAGGGVYVTGQSRDATTVVHECCYPDEYVTIRYDQATGDEDWVSRYDWTDRFVDSPYAIAMAPDGGTVYVTGGSRTGPGFDDYEDIATLAYDALTGDEVWAERYAGGDPTYDVGFAVAVSPDGSSLFVAGRSVNDAITIAYET